MNGKTNSIRPGVMGEPPKPERSPKPGETLTGNRKHKCGLKREQTKSRTGHAGCLETEWSEDRVGEAGRPAGSQTEFMLAGAEEPPGRSQSVRSSDETGNDRGAKGRRKVESVKVPTSENQPALVPEAAPQAGDIHDRWSWVELNVWTERMLMALENGVEGSKWFRLIDKVYAAPNLQSAFYAVWRNRGSAGVDGQTVAQFDQQHEDQLRRLGEELRQGRYQPHPVRRAWIPKPGSHEKRPLGIPAVRDRVVQAALRHVLEPIFEREFAEHSYGFRPGRGCKDALRRVDGLLKDGYAWIVDADLKGYFDTIPHERLLARVQERVADGRVIRLIEQFLKQGVMEELKGWQATERGTPQGAVISPLLANLYLNVLDHQIEARGWKMTRYADDFVIQCRSREEAEAALEYVRSWTEAEGLILHPEKTRIVDATQRGGFDFLGYNFQQGWKSPRKKSLEKLKETMRRRTRRNNPTSMEAIIQSLNPTLRGWFEYFKHSSHRSVFRALDGWIRMRLRSILRRRHHKRGRGRGIDHHHWPNAYFAQLGLYSLTAARTMGHQSR
jgi:RNA-directed DNA polymerase